MHRMCRPAQWQTENHVNQLDQALDLECYISIRNEWLSDQEYLSPQEDEDAIRRIQVEIKQEQVQVPSVIMSSSQHVQTILVLFM